MKVVIFCGGMGVRMGDATQRIPKPMISGGQPAHSLAHHALVRRLGTQGLHPLPGLSRRDRQTVVSRRTTRPTRTTSCSSDGQVSLLGSDMDDWRITFLDTGIHSSIGDRLRATQAAHRRRRGLPLHLRGRPHRCSARHDDRFARATARRPACFLSVRPRLSYHVVDADEDRTVALDRADGVRGCAHQRRVLRAPEQDLRRSASGRGHHGRSGAPGSRREDMIVYRYDGFWAPMDTMKDKQDLDALVEIGNGRAPWLKPKVGRAEFSKPDAPSPAWRRRRAGCVACSPSAATRTTSRSVAEAPCSR